MFIPDSYYSPEDKRTKRDEIEAELKDFDARKDKNKDGKLDLVRKGVLCTST